MSAGLLADNSFSLGHEGRDATAHVSGLPAGEAR